MHPTTRCTRRTPEASRRAASSSGMGAWALVALKERDAYQWGGKFRFDWVGVVEAFEDCFNVSQNREFTGASDVIPFQGYSTKQIAFPIFMHSFVIFCRMLRRCLACSSRTYFTPKLSTTRANTMGRVECVHRPGVFFMERIRGGQGRTLAFSGRGRQLGGDRTSPFIFRRTPSCRG